MLRRYCKHHQNTHQMHFIRKGKQFVSSNMANFKMRKFCPFLLAFLFICNFAAKIKGPQCAHNNRIPLHDWSLARDTVIISRRYYVNSMATHRRARQVQSRMPGSPAAIWAGANLLGRWLPSHVRQHLALSAVSRFHLRGATNTQQLWRKNFCSHRTSY